MASFAANLQAIRARISLAAQRAGRQPGEITLIAVSKGQPAERIADACAAGQRAFGENFAQEAVEKITKLGNLRLEWHFIGPLQSNKTGLIASRFQWVHSVEREKIAQRLHAARPADQSPLNVCIQVNVSGETSKSGVRPGAEEALAAAIVQLPGLKLRGLMAIPEPAPDTGVRRRRFALLRECQARLAARGYALDVLSMGMSDDFEDAIAEGATMVRIGTALFGAMAR
jgi:pyridoxal phosphate enzyme (YggS family)